MVSLLASSERRIFWDARRNRCDSSAKRAADGRRRRRYPMATLRNGPRQTADRRTDADVTPKRRNKACTPAIDRPTVRPDRGSASLEFLNETDLVRFSQIRRLTFSKRFRRSGEASIFPCTLAHISHSPFWFLSEGPSARHLPAPVLRRARGGQASRSKSRHALII